MRRRLVSEQAHNDSLLVQVCREISEAFLSLDFMFLWVLTLDGDGRTVRKVGPVDPKVVPGNARCT